jgi:hypothetical protein
LRQAGESGEEENFYGTNQACQREGEKHQRERKLFSSLDDNLITISPVHFPAVNRKELSARRQINEFAVFSPLLVQLSTSLSKLFQNVKSRSSAEISSKLPFSVERETFH